MVGTRGSAPLPRVIMAAGFETLLDHAVAVLHKTGKARNEF
jgi:hypothetical protein